LKHQVNTSFADQFSETALWPCHVSACCLAERSF